jgi:hypothetical protein
MQAYTNTGPVDTNVDFDTSRVKGQTAIVTGGGSNTGEQRDMRAERHQQARTASERHTFVL